MWKGARAAAAILALAWFGTACDGLSGSSATVYRVRDSDFAFDFDVRDACIAQQAANCTFPCSGTVVDDEGMTVAGAVVAVFDDDDATLVTGSTDASGHFLIGITRPTEGTWQVAVCAADEELDDPGEYGNMRCMYAGQNYN
jgi:hypothetical protein